LESERRKTNKQTTPDMEKSMPRVGSGDPKKEASKSKCRYKQEGKSWFVDAAEEHHSSE
jgi:hypothetical protein